MDSGGGYSGVLAEVFSQARPQEGEKIRFRCECAYDGTDFCGWQSQKGGGSVQDFIEGRLERIFKEPVRIHGSGRTDAGVHARRPGVPFRRGMEPPDGALLAALRSSNRADVRIKSLKRVGKDFHARYGAKGKRYVYYMHRGVSAPAFGAVQVVFEGQGSRSRKMRAAAGILIGQHDFTAFSASRGADARENPVKTLSRLSVASRGAELRVVAEGSGFMYKMVRMLVGALVDVGTGRLDEGDIMEILASKKRGNYFQAAPAQGLFLQRVFY